MDTHPKPITTTTTTTTKEDPIAYRIAIGAIGVALVAFLIGACVIAAGGKPIPTQYWTTGSSITGALLGILAPTPTPADPKAEPKGFWNNIVVAIKDLWSNRGLFLLLIVFITSVVLGATSNSPELLGVAAAAGGALVGLLAPPPGSTSGPAGGGP